MQYIALQKENPPVKIKEEKNRFMSFSLTEGMKMEKIFRLKKQCQKSKNPIIRLAGIFYGMILKGYIWKLERKYGTEFEEELEKRQEETWQKIQKQIKQERKKQEP